MQFYVANYMRNIKQEYGGRGKFISSSSLDDDKINNKSLNLGM
jgi:hypothetical protein